MSTQKAEGLSIYDMYVLNNSGLPVFAGCTLSDFCLAHADQHPLHTGFLAALLSFGNEVFSGNLQNLKFPTVNVNMKTVGDYTFVFVNPKDVYENFIKSKLDEFAKVFREKYENEIAEGYVTNEQFENFQQDMIELGLIPTDRLKSTKDYFITDQGESEEKSSSLMDRFKQKFRSLIKK
ncbi:MAG: hypothetical protein HeimC2_19300 [Candidatus Heimdallarchaeota archaeon LC_2]|nr:MAG: hypothetical protein HeimC2_19300 [Candidatus Heimdallarchaeota archaeon LC_2]